MINCNLAKELINQDLDNELNSDLNDQLEGHLVECESCYLYRQELLKLHNNLLKLPEINLSTSIVDSLIAEEKLVAPKANTTPRFRKLNIWHGLIAAVIIAIVYIPVSGLINNNKEYSLNSNEAQYSGDVQRFVESPVEGVSPISGVDENSSAMKIQATHEHDINTQEIDINNQELDSGDIEPDKINQESEVYSLVSGSTDYRVEIVDNQLIIYDSSNNEVFVSTEWNDKYTPNWDIYEKDFVDYQLFDENGQVVVKYRINLIEKKEEIIN